LKTGTVRIAAPQLMACTLLPEVIAAYHALHPEIQIRLADCAVESVLARVASGEADCGIGPQRATRAEVNEQMLFEMPFMVVFPKQHPLRKLARITWNDALRYPVIALQGQFTERLTLDLHVALRELNLNPSNEVAFMTTALSMVSAGLGVTACLPYAASLVKLHDLRMCRLHEPELTRQFMVYTHANTSPSPAVASFIAFLFEFVASHDWSGSAEWRDAALPAAAPR
jgi:DNA-binding transcriptional LysR family regulator